MLESRHKEGDYFPYGDEGAPLDGSCRAENLAVLIPLASATVTAVAVFLSFVWVSRICTTAVTNIFACTLQCVKHFPSICGMVPKKKLCIMDWIFC